MICRATLLLAMAAACGKVDDKVDAKDSQSASEPARAAKAAVGFEDIASAAGVRFTMAFLPGEQGAVERKEDGAEERKDDVAGEPADAEPPRGADRCAPVPRRSSHSDRRIQTSCFPASRHPASPSLYSLIAGNRKLPAKGRGVSPLKA